MNHAMLIHTLLPFSKIMQADHYHDACDPMIHIMHHVNILIDVRHIYFVIY